VYPFRQRPEGDPYVGAICATSKISHSSISLLAPVLGA
jgi:hypothetical protein